MGFEGLAGHVPQERSCVLEDLLGQGGREDCAEVLLSEVAEEVESAVGDSWVALVGESEMDPGLSLRHVLEDLGVVVGQEDKHSGQLQRG